MYVENTSLPTVAAPLRIPKSFEFAVLTLGYRYEYVMISR